MMMRSFLSPQGGASLDAQAQQLSLRRDKLLPKLQKVLGAVQSPDFSSKVPAAVRQRMETQVSWEGPAGAWVRGLARHVSGTFSLSEADAGAGAQEHRGADEDPEEPVTDAAFCCCNKDVDAPPS